MIVNNRKMGEKTGRWFGREIEYTPFHGMVTIFFSRFSALEQNVYEPHVFIALCNPKFWMGCEKEPYASANIDRDMELMHMLIQSWLIQGKKVTVEATPAQAALPFLSKLRRVYKGQFCLLVSIEMPLVDLQGYVLKAVPTHLFEGKEFEGGVQTFYPGGGGYTSWIEYENDLEEE